VGGKVYSPMSATDARLLLAGARGAEAAPPQEPLPPTLGPWAGQAAAAQAAVRRRPRGTAAQALPRSFSTEWQASASAASKSPTKASGKPVQLSMQAMKRSYTADWQEQACHDPASPSNVSTKGSSGTSSSPVRRKSGMLGIAARLRQISVETFGSWDGAPHRAPQRCIRRCRDFSELYQLGEPVAKSIHKKLEIKYAVAKAGAWPGAAGTEVVVKVRHKGSAFSSRRSEQAWRASNERFLNLPACHSIVHVHDILEDDLAYYVVMERVGGKDLRDTLSLEGRMGVEEAKEVLRQLLHGVDELHASGCIHKDIKMENVMLDRSAQPVGLDTCSVGSHRPATPSTCASTPIRWPSEQGADLAPPVLGQPSGGSVRSSVSGAGRVLDLTNSPPGVAPSPSPVCGPDVLPPGAVKLVDFDTLQEWTPQTPKATDVLGTDQYIAPEAYEGRYSPASDIFAVGVCAYKLLTASMPFRRAIFDDKPGENWVGSPKMLQIRARLCEERVDWRHPVFQRDGGPQALISRMLSVDDRLRPTAREALADSWLASRSGCPLSPLWVPLAQMP